VQHDLGARAATAFTLIFGVVIRITITAQPRRCAASATPCAWLPALAAITPFASRARGRSPSCCSAGSLTRTRLQILALQQQPVLDPLRERRRKLERRFDSPRRRRAPSGSARDSRRPHHRAPAVPLWSR